MKMLGLDKKVVMLVVERSLLVLMIPLIASFFIKDWNWSFSDYIFAFCMFFVFQFIYQILIKRFENKFSKDFIAFIVILVFAIIWGTLATG